MSASSSSNSAALTSEERWRRWEQRGLDNEIRFRRRVYRFFWTPALLLAVLLLFWLLR
jgi:hypothetical protein